MPGTMLILPGNAGHYPDENGKTTNYDHGALHERAALDYAAAKGYVGEILHKAGNDDAQITEAVAKLKPDDSPYTAIYGFSGGGYHLLHILDQLPEDALARIELVVALGSPPTFKVQNPDTKKFSFPNCDTDLKGNLKKWETHSCSPMPTAYDPGHFAAKFSSNPSKIHWDVVYWTNPSPKGHMFGPDWLLAQELLKPKAP